MICHLTCHHVIWDVTQIRGPRRTQLHSSECECQPQHKGSRGQAQTRGRFATPPAHAPQEGCGQGAQGKAGGRFQARGDQGGRARVTRGPRSDPRPGGGDESRTRVGPSSLQTTGRQRCCVTAGPTLFLGDTRLSLQDERARLLKLQCCRKKCVDTERGEGRHSTAQKQTVHQREPNTNTGESGLMTARSSSCCFCNSSTNWKSYPRVLQEAPCWLWLGEWTGRRPLGAPLQLDMAGTWW